MSEPLQFQNFNLKTYEEQRYLRLLESVDEYLSSEDVGSSKFLDDLQKICLELRQYHDNAVASFNHVQEFFS